MNPEKTYEMVRFFADCGERFESAYLQHVDIERLILDRTYGLKAFLFSWAFERAGAPRSFRIAAVKAVSSLNGSQAELPNFFKKFCDGKRNEKLNPLFDRRIIEFDVPSVVELAKQGDIQNAFQKLKLNGIGHKVRALFLRDLVTLLKVESVLRENREDYLWCQPIDIWVRTAAKELCGNSLPSPRDPKKFELGVPDLKLANAIVNLSIAASVSPLKVNEGIWFYAANTVGDVPRLKKLVGSGEVGELQAELALMEGFLPERRVFA